ncbi:hypothetical protein Barb7_02321 [Bacteroidales bacterium Barb7]|nr:hypothetical protein Barb6XT_00631 [Bacteroidales bacterium Barb6XT]OAV74205.1 hypothetical protein Barb7_02321 [Bacteroidales bacterium Barb7]
METETILTGKRATVNHLVAKERPKATQKQIDEAKRLGVPIDEYGVPIGTPWEEVLEGMYDRLSAHYGVDLRTL